MINVLSLFSGIGAFESALRRGGYNFRIINYCEIDPHAAKAYSQIHGISEDYNLNDVCTVNPLLMDNVNLVTYGFPCQDISIAGKQKGFKDTEGNRTRSGLFFEALRIIEFLQPEYAIAENVKALTGKKFTAEFETVLTSLDKAGYNNYWKVLNAKDYGVPQNRERVFIVSIRKDIDKGTFTFPEKQPLTLRLKDLLESVVDEKYYLKSQRADDLIRQILAKTDTGKGMAGIPNVQAVEPKIKRLGNLYDANAGGARAGNTYDPDGLAPALQTAQGGNRQPLIYENYRIRKLTPKECFRLMGFTDADFNKIKGISNTQLYKMAGNSIVVNVLEAIFKQLFKESHK